MVLAIALLAIAPAPARAAITLTPGANTAATPNLELNFGDGTGNVERVDGLKWRGGANLAAAGGPGPSCSPSEPLEAWGQSYGDSNTAPVLVAAGSTGTWTPRGGRTVEIASSEPKACFNGSVVTPVRTRYTFFDTGAAADKVRIERRAGFDALTPSYPNTQGLRAYVSRISSAYSQMVHPNGAGTALVTDSACPDGCVSSNWNTTWLAINDPQSNAGVVILRDPASTGPAKLVFDYDSFSGSTTSGITLTQPANGWTSALTEIEYLCFYDAASWPPASRAPNTLPPGCSAAPVPVNTAVPTISGTPRRGSAVTASPGTWESQAGAFAYRWARCASNVCTNIPGGTAQTYTPTDDDVGKKLRVTVTAAASGGEQDAATSAQTADVAQAPPDNTAPPSISGSVAPGQTLTAAEGGWAGAPASFKYQWRRCSSSPDSCSDIAGATAKTLVLTAADAGARFRVRVVAHNAAGDSAPAESAATAITAAGRSAPSLLEAPSIITPRDPVHEGDEVQVDRGRWSGAASFRFQWLRCDGFGANCGEIAGATGERYLLAGADVTRTIRARVFADGDGGTSQADSAAAGPVQDRGPLAASFTMTPNPTCTDVRNTFDARQSTGGPAGIAKYRFTYWKDIYPEQPGDFPVSAVARATRLIAEGPEPVVVGPVDNPRPVAYAIGGQNIFGIWGASRTLVYQYDPTDVTLTVTDRNGATASVTKHVDFVRKSGFDTSACPKGVPYEEYRPPVKDVAKTVVVSGTSISATVPCTVSIRCTGAVRYMGFGGASSRAASAKKRTVRLAGGGFDIEAGARKVVKAKLTKAGRRALRGRRRVKAVLEVGVLRQGKVVTTSRRITLKRKKR